MVQRREGLRLHRSGWWRKGRIRPHLGSRTIRAHRLSGSDAFLSDVMWVTDATAALEGARAILVERFSEDASLIGTLREEVWLRGRLRSRVRAGKAETGAKFADYFEFSEPLLKLPSHRILALFRGEKEEVLALELVPDPTVLDRGEPGIFERQIANQFKITDQGRPGDRWLIDTVRLAWR